MNIKKTLFLFCFLFFFKSISHSQAWTYLSNSWSQIIGTSLIQTKNDKLLHAARFASNTGLIYLSVSLFNIGGDLLWQKGFENAESVIELKDGRFLVTGRTFHLINQEGELVSSQFIALTFKTAAATNDGGFILAGYQSDVGSILQRFDASQNIVWTDTLTSPPNRVFSYNNVLFEQENGNIILSSTGSNPAIHQFDKNGVEIWKRALPNQDSEILRIKKIVPSEDGKLIFVGDKQFRTSNQNLENDIIVGKLSRNGELLWWQSYSFRMRDRFKDLIVNNQGEIVIVGSSSDLSVHSTNLFKLNSDGNLIWRRTKRNNVDSDLGAQFYGVIQFESDNFYVLASSKKETEDDQALPTVYKYNYDGKVLDSTYYLQDRINEEILKGVILHMIQAGDDSFAFSGVLLRQNIVHKKSFVIKEKALISNAQHTIIENKILRVFPNPTKNIINFELLTTPPEQIQFFLFDNLGRRVYKNAYRRNSFQINRSKLGLPPGSYFFQMINNGKIIDIGRIIFQ